MELTTAKVIGPRISELNPQLTSQPAKPEIITAGQLGALEEVCVKISFQREEYNKQLLSVHTAVDMVQKNWNQLESWILEWGERIRGRELARKR